jgi:hypothetical protein
MSDLYFFENKGSGNRCGKSQREEKTRYPRRCTGICARDREKQRIEYDSHHKFQQIPEN